MRVESFFECEARPHVPDAWIDSKRRDPQDGRVGLVGYEINFNRYFYEYRPPRPLEEIEADVRQVEKEIAAMLEEMRGRCRSVFGNCGPGRPTGDCSRALSVP